MQLLRESPPTALRVFWVVIAVPRESVCVCLQKRPRPCLQLRVPLSESVSVLVLVLAVRTVAHETVPRLSALRSLTRALRRRRIWSTKSTSPPSD